jgi:hypothetical protein
MTYAPAQPATGARRHAWIAVLVVGVALFLAIERTLVATQNPNFVPSAILGFLPMVGVGRRAASPTRSTCCCCAAS